jgi:DNA-directed RNA polymerase subunit omega
VAERTIRADDLREDYVHSLQKHVEVDEPEESETPLLAAAGESEARSQEPQEQYERMSEEDLLRGLDGLPPAESPGSQRSGY